MISSISGTEELKEFYMSSGSALDKDDSFFFSTRSGVGYDFSTVITYYFANPLVFITYLLLPKSSLSTFLIFYLSLKLV